jgi:hypothetical protein
MRPRLALAFLLLVCPARAHAHALGTDCRLAGERVEVEAYYEDDTPARQARVRVVDAHQALVAEGRTDEAGKWAFPRPAPGRYEVVVDAGASHRHTTPITVPASSVSAAPRVSAGRGRAELTRTPWPRLLIGVLAIAAASGLFLLIGAWRKGRRPRDKITPG